MINPLKLPISEIYRHKIKVESFHLDFFQHVNNAIYLNYLESARVGYLGHYGISFDDFLTSDGLPVVASANMKFKRPAFMGDELTILTYLSERKRVSITFSYEIYNQHHELIHEAETVLVFVNKENKAVEIPTEYLQLFVNQ